MMAYNHATGVFYIRSRFKLRKECLVVASSWLILLSIEYVTYTGLIARLNPKCYLLVFRRKDLCDARAKPKMSSKLQMQTYPPPVEASGGQEQYYVRSS